VPWEQSANPVITKDKKRSPPFIFTRKLTFVAILGRDRVFAGGSATLDEVEALTLMPTGKSRLMPLIMLDYAGARIMVTWDRTIASTAAHNKLISRRTRSAPYDCPTTWTTR